jgi:mycothiol synthase
VGPGKPVPVRVEPSNTDLFVEYSSRHGKDHDDSYLPNNDFPFGEDYPAYLLMSGESAVGAACLMRTKRLTAEGRGRFVIYHTVSGEKQHYAQLLQAFGPHLVDLSYVYLFIPSSRLGVRAAWEELGFAVERFSFVLKYEGAAVEAPELPPGFAIRPFSVADTADVVACTELTNINFAGMGGHVENHTEDILELFTDPSYVDDGIMLLTDNQHPVGTLQIARDEEDSSSAFVEMLSVHPDFRRRGLGRALLRKAISFAASRGFRDVYLSVNGENDTAVSLYVASGFAIVKELACYGLDVSSL